MSYAKSVKIVEVAPRDGLQNEATTIGISERVRFIEELTDAGLWTIECGSFVSPKWVPQMAGTADVLRQLKRTPGVRYTVLVPNLKGLEAAIESGVEEIAVFASASESFSQHNINCSTDESLSRMSDVAQAALARGIRVRGYVSCVLGCPYEGDISLKAVTRVAAALAGMGCYEVSLGDTIGVGTPRKARAMLSEVAEHVPIDRLAAHFHDTWGQALANVLACLEMGLAVVDSAAGGLGGCPYAKGASGNLATEDLLYMLQGMNIETGIDLGKVAATGWRIANLLGRQPSSKAALAWKASRTND
ncbi:MAG TPA: hydroxymethylglutaryl-CoA lyase [Bryobacteraceae bacterium]|jgi:hydroxymethylglutaryl-CoA lyase|nr:hydroxymethylglutaryl-CoA lyase [Bryobacteraceae bacterium]